MKKIAYLLFLVSTMSFSQEWITDFDEAKEIASANNQKILLVFQGSDWCAPCIKLDREIWSTDAFKAYAKDHYVMVQADFPRKKKNALPEELAKTNALLADTYNKQGIFPFVVLLDVDGRVLGQTSYKKITPEAYIQHLESFTK